ncbi:MAG: hemerythrin family protein [Magnetococcales bacterium]|nr:hemerythrin family protein [Magnetococcales bacterium]
MNATPAMPDKYLVGHPAIDAQHQLLFMLFDEITLTLKGEEHTFSMEHVFASLDTYVKTHFSFEEELMKTVTYSKKSDHLQEHRALEGKVSAYAKRFTDADDVESQRTIAEETHAFLFKWLTEHIAQTDREFSSVLKKE